VRGLKEVGRTINGFPNGIEYKIYRYKPILKANSFYSNKKGRIRKINWMEKNEDEEDVVYYQCGYRDESNIWFSTDSISSCLRKSFEKWAYREEVIIELSPEEWALKYDFIK
jgi:hypothetical protein